MRARHPLRDHDVSLLADDQVRTDFVLSTDVLAWLPTGPRSLRAAADCQRTVIRPRLM
ncbi:hypothetical protein PT2222_400008 [Paraburkholderia tropica]